MSVSENVGANSSQQAIDFTLKTTEQILALLQALLNRKGKRNYKEADKGAKAIADHLKKGGKTNVLPIPEDKAALFESFLKAEHVPYVMLKDHNNGQLLFQTRDIDDKLVERAFNRFDSIYNKQTHEFRLDEFLTMHRGEEVCEINHVSELELEMFRRDAMQKNNGLQYSVIHDPHDKTQFSIIVTGQDYKNASATLKGVHFDLRSPDAKSYREKLSDAITLKNQIYNENKRNPEKRQVILSKNPNRFITIENGALYVHSLSSKKVKGRGGKEFYEVTDNVTSKRPFGNVDLIKALTSLGEFKIGSKEDITFITSFDKEGKAICDGDAFQKYADKFKKMDKSDFTCSYSHLRVNEQSITREKAITLQKIEPVLMQQILAEMESHNIPHYSRGSSIAFSVEDVKQVDNILDNTLYDKLNAREKFEAKTFYEGRSTNEFKIGEDHLFIYSSELKATIEVASDGLIVHNDKDPVRVKIDDPNFDKVLGSVTGHYCVLTEEEYKNKAQRNDLQHKLMQDNKDHKLTDDYLKAYDKEKDVAIQTDVHLEQIVRQYEVRTFTVNQGGAERLTSQTFENQEHTTSKRQTRSQGMDI